MYSWSRKSAECYKLVRWHRQVSLAIVLNEVKPSVLVTPTPIIPGRMRYTKCLSVAVDLVRQLLGCMGALYTLPKYTCSPKRILSYRTHARLVIGELTNSSQKTSSDVLCLLLGLRPSRLHRAQSNHWNDGRSLQPAPADRSNRARCLPSLVALFYAKIPSPNTVILIDWHER